MILTFQYRIKDGNSHKVLNQMARSVNTVWNYCREVQEQAFSFHNRWLSGFDLNKLTKGCSKELGLHSQSVQVVCEQYQNSRRVHRKRQLRWRGRKSLGWVPFKSAGVKVSGNQVRYAGHTFRFWLSRPVPETIKTGSFSQDARGRWYVSFQCEVPDLPQATEQAVGIDLGLKTLATLSNGEQIENPRWLRSLEDQLRYAQSKDWKRRTRQLHAKIKNSRKDFIHKATTEISKKFRTVVVGDVSSKKLKKTRFAKSVSDAGWAMLRNFLMYKTRLRGGECKVVSETNSTRACSGCGSLSGPQGRKGLSIREWICGNCEAEHLRDLNAARNILTQGLLALGEPRAG